MSGADLVAVAAPGVLDGPATAQEVFERAAAARGISTRVVQARSQEEFLREVAAARTVDEPIVLPADPALLDDVLPPGRPVLRVDLDVVARDRSAVVRAHVRHRGLAGLRFGVDAWWSARASPSTRHAYGPHPDQHACLHLPPGRGPFPVSVLLHGGYWRSRWEGDLMGPLAVDLVGRGRAVWNVEYRRPDEHGWDATTADVAAAVAALVSVEAPLDLTRVSLLGHSAGGQLAARLAADLVSRQPGDGGAGVVPAVVVSLAGCLDLRRIHARGLSEGAVRTALGGDPDELPDRYAASSPVERLPVGLPLAVVCCTGDDPDLLDVSRRFAAAAAQAGDDVEVVERSGDHFSLIDPASAVWQDVVQLLDRRGL